MLGSVTLIVVLFFDPLFSHVFRYDITKGDVKKIVEWKIVRNDNDYIEFCSENEMENVSHRMTLAPDLSTLSWSFVSHVEDIHYTVKRIGDTVVYSGELGEETLDKSEYVGELPWHQIHGCSFPEFLKSGKQKIEFFSIRPEDGKLFNLVAERKGTENIKVNGETCRAIRVHVHLPGLLSYMGGVNYWFRQDDLVFVKYHGMSGFPGSAPIIYELAEIISSEKDT
jgi:hypothetical protein